MEKGNKLNFSGQHIYVGMDVHKKSWSVSIQSEQFEHKTFTQPPEVEKLTGYLERTFPGATLTSFRDISMAATPPISSVPAQTEPQLDFRVNMTPPHHPINDSIAINAMVDNIKSDILALPSRPLLQRLIPGPVRYEFRQSAHSGVIGTFNRSLCRSLCDRSSIRCSIS